MGTSLLISGNHNIKFQDRSYEDLTREICDKLNGIEFINEAFLRNNASSGPTLSEWIAREENDLKLFERNNELEFDGPHGLNLTVDKNRVDFHDPSHRYYLWFKEEENIRNGWRLYFYQVLKCLGGDKVIYLADNAHRLERYAAYAFEGSFEEMEFLMGKELGMPETDFDEINDIYDNEDFPYFLDTFSDISFKTEDS